MTTDSFHHVYEGSHKGAKIYFWAHLLKIAKVCKQVPLHLFAKDRKGVQTSICAYLLVIAEMCKEIFSALFSGRAKTCQEGFGLILVRIA